MAELVQVSQWHRFDWLRAGFSTRLGGVSTVYACGNADQLNQLNLGWTPEDDPAVVAENRRFFASAVSGGAALELVTVRQIHGAHTHRVSAACGELVAADGKALLQGDGLMTNEPGWLLAVQTADCVPVLLADTRTRAVAAFHAGWRGTLARIVEHGVARMGQEFGTRPEDIVAAVGPGIRPCCFEVGEEVRARFVQEFSYGPQLFAGPALFAEAGLFPGPTAFAGRDGSLTMDLQDANRRQLLAAGVGVDAITVVAECSACSRTPGGGRRYFSHRAEKGVTGRMMSAIGIVEQQARD